MSCGVVWDFNINADHYKVNLGVKGTGNVIGNLIESSGVSRRLSGSSSDLWIVLRTWYTTVVFCNVNRPVSLKAEIFIFY